jgi:exopolyphosphatase/guanosine-5'-triphosphate,3'-diphosphate pyrophosphatase
MRLAAIDIGTNSVHMIVVQVHADHSFEVIDREKEMVRLGAGGLDGRALTDSAMSAGLQALSKFKRLADSYQVDDVLAAATSATREAENGGDFLAAIEEHTGIRARIISGAEEARLIHLAAAYGISLGRQTGVVIDIGGGSVEITYGTPTEVTLAESFKIGVIRLTERFVKSDPLSERDERRLVKHVNEAIGAHVDAILARGVERVIGTSGTILSLGALAADNGDGLPTDLRNLRVSAKALRRLRKRLVSLDLQERLAVEGMDPRRADLSVAGIVLLDTIVRRLEATELTLCDFALREGLVLDYIGRNESKIASIDRYPDIRRRSVVELGERCHYSPEHTQHIATLALSLFDETAHLHGLDAREREWLEYGALLHDVGVHISYKNHHKHSYYLVRHGDLRGFEPEEIEIIGLITRYHRRGTPKKNHEGFETLGQDARRVVKRLSAFVRLAEALDRSHAQLVSRVDVQDRGVDLLLRLWAEGDVELELWAAHRHLPTLEEELGRVIRLEVVTRPRPAVANAPAVPGPPARQPRSAPGARRGRRASA